MVDTELRLFHLVPKQGDSSISRYIEICTEYMSQEVGLSVRCGESSHCNWL